jgi:hypothetical protein
MKKWLVSIRPLLAGFDSTADRKPMDIAQEQILLQSQADIGERKT